MSAVGSTTACPQAGPTSASLQRKSCTSQGSSSGASLIHWHTRSGHLGTLNRTCLEGVESKIEIQDEISKCGVQGGRSFGSKRIHELDLWFGCHGRWAGPLIWGLGEGYIGWLEGPDGIEAWVSGRGTVIHVCGLREEGDSWQA